MPSDSLMSDLEPRVISCPNTVVVQRKHTMPVSPITAFLHMSVAVRLVRGPTSRLDLRLDIPWDMVGVYVEVCALDIWRL